MCVTKYMIQRTIVGLSYTVCLETNACMPVIIVKLSQRTATGVLYKQCHIRSVSAEWQALSGCPYYTSKSTILSCWWNVAKDVMDVTLCGSLFQAHVWTGESMIRWEVDVLANLKRRRASAWVLSAVTQPGMVTLCHEYNDTVLGTTDTSVYIVQFRMN